MSWINRIFNKKKQSPFFLKIEALILQITPLSDIEYVYYLGGGEYSEDNLKNVIGALKSGNEDFFISSFNSKSDNIELFVIKCLGKKSIALVILDPVELYHSAETLFTIPLDLTTIIDNMGEKIYPL